MNPGKAGSAVWTWGYNFLMRKFIFSFFVLSVFAMQPLCAQEPAAPTVGPGAEMQAGGVHENMPYGTVNGIMLLLDIFEPAGDHGGNARPAVILVHGGGWTSFDKSTMRNLAQFLARNGFVGVPVDYRLFQDDATRWPAQLDDVQRAVRWIRANATKYNIDPNRIVVYGHSSGGQLALLLGMVDTRDNSDAALAKYSSKVQAVVDASAPTDFTKHVNDDSTKFLASFFGTDFAQDPKVWREASPIFHVSKTNAPILLIHGTRDDMVPIAESEALNDALTKTGANVQFLRLDSDHVFREPGVHRQLAVETRAFFAKYLVTEK
jgi:acetyl esterase/lipase